MRQSMKLVRPGPAIEVDQIDTMTQAASADLAIALETEPNLRRFATNKTINDDHDKSSSSEDSFIDSSDDAKSKRSKLDLASDPVSAI